ncbi:ABC transporter ATP-binding protein [Tessaracoccus caeni]|uniref:ABC transporter ATP-binding protein n=1 Tax=Tessaracoccus caeni TaxID=3031239 RepID=UPI0023DACBB3|nr:ABC transporter ATP-binding protein [Tessaracoccus caeni]MDF1489873.1 ABC transporter ATP-binding protein [Tessaracoccus caeni]
MRRILQLMHAAAGPYLPQWQRSLRLTELGAVANGIAVVLLLPLVVTLLEGNHQTGLVVLIALGVLLVVESLLRVGELNFSYTLFPELMSDIRLRLGEKLRRIPAEELARRRSGGLSTVINQDVTMSLLSVSEVASLMLRLIVIPLAFVVSLAAIDMRLLLGALVGAAVAAFFIARTNAAQARAQRVVGEADAETADRIVEYVQGLPVLKASGQAGERSERLVAALRHQGAALRSSIDQSIFGLTGGAIGANLAVAGVVAMGAALVLRGELSAVMAAAVVVAAAGLAEPLARAATMTSVFEVAEGAMTRIDEVLSIPALPEPDEPAVIEGHDIAFDDVTFTYRDAAAPAVQGVTLELRAGTLTAFVGPSGSGKTTMTRLISRFADPQQGRVLIGGTDIREVTGRELMRHIAVVFQDVHLFDTTIFDNVAMARPEATKDEVHAALEAANCGELIARLPNGAATRVGEIGNQLSGGERQRVAIARALLKDAPIVLLDEPTSALDTESEVMVQEAIDRLVANKTVVVIAHRLSTVVAADQIVVLEDGEVREVGDHTSLLAADGRYSRMWAAQTRARGWTLT